MLCACLGLDGKGVLPHLLFLKLKWPVVCIFDDIRRERADPPQQGEPSFAYLNLSNRPEAARVRALIDEWFGRYPMQHREALVSRFRSPIGASHVSAFFELFLHELALRNGMRVIAIEPKLEHTGLSPDFLLEDAKKRFYLEAVVATGVSQDEASAEARLNQALAALDNLPSPCHFLDLHVRGVPNAPISLKRLKRDAQRWIAELPEGEATRHGAPFVYQEHGVRIMLTAWPRQNRERAGRPIGVRHFPVQAVVPNEDIRTSLMKKASRYGQLDHPYVVAVNTAGMFHGEEDTFDALFGTPQHVTRQFGDGRVVSRDEDAADGVWGTAVAPKKRGLSAALTIERVDPWNFAGREACLIRNPWAAKPLLPVGFGIGELNPVDGRFERKQGSPMHAILGLQKDWPLE